MTRRVLVTGGAGYIGANTCKLLARSEVTPVVYDSLVTGHRDDVRWGPFVEGDILDADRLDQTLAEYCPEAVFHFAGSAYVGESVEDPAKYYRNNVTGSLTLLEACRRAGVKNFVFSSSCATYGAPERLPINEATLQRPLSPYGRSKLMIENILADYSAAYDLRYVALRYFNACGADPDGELAERHDPETHLIPLALLSASGARPPLSIFGGDYPTADGTCERDFVHVTDLARAHILALDYLRGGGGSLAVNLGSGHALSIRAILKAIRRVTARDVPIVVAPRRTGDPPALVADPDLARQRLGFSTLLSDIDTIVRTAAPSFGLNTVA